MQGNINRGLKLGLFLVVSVGLCGCANLHQDDLTASGIPDIGVVDPGTNLYPEDSSKVILSDWPAYRPFPQQIRTVSDWSMHYVLLMENGSPKFSTDWGDVAFYLANSSNRPRLKALLAFAYDSKLPYFLSYGDSLDTRFVKMGYFIPRGDNGIMVGDRSKYREAHGSGPLNDFLRFVHLKEGDPTTNAYDGLAVEQLPRAPRASTSRATPGT